MATDNQEKAKICENCKFFREYRSSEGIVLNHFCEQNNVQVFGHFKCSCNKFETR